MVQLDTLRAFAVTAVVIHHLTPGGWNLGAYLGVKLFFTLSGFLITGILLKTRRAAEIEGHARTKALGRFYMRRFLRIFPLYYSIIAVAWIINLNPARKIITSLLTYTLNIHMARQGWYEDNFAHFWSLSVEEQFYLFWPWLVLFLPKNWIKPAIVTVIAIGPLYRFSYVLSGFTNMTRLSPYISTAGSLDNLGAGAFLAILVSRSPAGATNKAWLDRSLLLASFLLVIAANTLFRDGWSYYLLYDPAHALAFCIVIYYAANGFRGVFGRALQWRPIVYIGRISYGIYVYHPFMHALAIFLILRFGSRLPLTPHSDEALLTVALTLVVASVSWTLMEKPLNDLKRYF